MLEQSDRQHATGPAPVEAEDPDPLLPAHLGAPFVCPQGCQALVGEELGVGEPGAESAEHPLPCRGGGREGGRTDGEQEE